MKREYKRYVVKVAGVKDVGYPWGTPRSIETFYPLAYSLEEARKEVYKQLINTGGLPNPGIGTARLASKDEIAQLKASHIKAGEGYQG